MDLLQGRIDATISIPHHPWDNAAGSFLVNEATGMSKLLDGTTYNPSTPVQPYSHAAKAETPRLLAARSAEIWAETRDKLLPLL